MMNYLFLIRSLREEAIFQADRFGRRVLADELNDAAKAIEELTRRAAPENVRNLLETIHTLRHENANLVTKIERSRNAAPESKALTLEQLRQMDGEPVWLQLLPVGIYGSRWAICNGGNTGNFTTPQIVLDQSCWGEDSYGKTWLAYARRPESTQ